MIQAALRGLQCCLSAGKWRFGGGEELGSTLANLKVEKCIRETVVKSFELNSKSLEVSLSSLQRFMFQGTPGVSVEWPAMLYPAPLPQYECQVTAKPLNSAGVSDKAAKDTAAEPSKASAVRFHILFNSTA